MQFEKTLSIPVPKTRFKVFGKFQGRKSQALCIMVHGLTGNMDESFYRLGTEYLARRGFATYRLNLYGWPKGSRRLPDSTLRTHAQDLNAVTAYFRRKGFRKIFVVGHSYGGATILLSNPKNVDGAVLWDPTHAASFTSRKWGGKPARFVRELNAYLVDWGVVYLFGTAMIKEADQLNWDQLAMNFTAPTRIICAGSGVLKDGCKLYFETLPGKKDLKIVPHATHYFNDRAGMEDSVFRLTEQWFRKLATAKPKSKR